MEQSIPRNMEGFERFLQYGQRAQTYDKKERPKQRITYAGKGFSEHSALQHLHEQQCPPPGQAKYQVRSNCGYAEWCHCAVLGRMNLRYDLWFGTVTTSNTGGRSKKARLAAGLFQSRLQQGVILGRRLLGVQQLLCFESLRCNRP